MVKSRKADMPVIRIVEKCIVLFMISTLVITLFNQLTIINCIMFFIFQIFGILIPGIAVCFVLRINLDTDVELVAIGYVMGYSLNILTYYLIVPLGFKAFSSIVLLVITVVATKILYSNRYRKIKQDKKGFYICLLFFCIVFLIELLTYCGANLLPTVAKQNNYYSDVMYWIGNSIELANEYPPKNFRNCLSMYNYHYFSSIQLALISLCTKINPVVLGFCYSYIQPVFMFVFGAYCLFAKCTQKMYAVVVLMVGLLFTSGLETTTIVTFTAHMYLGQFGFDVGFGIMLFFLYFILLQYKEKIFEWRYCVVSIVLFAILMGVKSPFAAVALSGMGIMSLVYIFKREYKKSLLYGLPMLFVFICLYFFVCNMNGYFGSAEKVFQNVEITYETTEAIVYYRMLIMKLQQLFVPRIICEILFTFLYCVLSNIFCYTIFFTIIFLKVIIRKWEILDTVCCVIAASGAIVSIYVAMNGHSQMYFMMATYPAVLLLIAYNIDMIMDYPFFKKISIKIIIAGIIFVLMSIGVYCWYIGCWDWSIRSSLKKGINNYMEKEPISAIHDNTYVNSAMYEAYEWINEKTNKNAIIGSNSDSLAQGIFTQRYILPIDERVLIGDKDDLKSWVKEAGAQYIIIDRQVNKEKFREFSLSEEDGKLIFQNEMIRFYQIDL